jgi:alcohol dehydrogenase YqhD (iron-dependent ADH family)
MGAVIDGDFWDLFSGKAKIETTLPVGSVLTIAAAGSEGSDSCVITYEKTEPVPVYFKWGCPKTDIIRPKFAVMNPRYTCSLPAYQTACGATDMIAHVCERYFTNTKDVEITDRMGEAIMKTIIHNAPKAMKNPEDYNARAELMWAGTLAHNNCCGVGRVQDWASHQTEHEVSALCDCAHGAGLAVVLPAWMEYVLPHDVSRFAQFAVRVWDCDMDFQHPEETAKEGIRRFRAFLKDLGMPQTLAELGITGDMDDNIAAIVKHRGENPVGFPFGGFVKIGEKEMTEFLHQAI